MPTSLSASPIAPIQKNVDSRDVVKRSVDKRPKRIPVIRSQSSTRIKGGRADAQRRPSGR